MLRLRLLAAAICLMPPVPTVPIERIATVVPAPAAVAAAHRFGVSVALDRTRLVVGADGRRDGPPEPGLVAIYRRTTAARWRLERIVRAGTPTPGDRFGASLALDGDRLLVGAPGDREDRGAVWMIDLADPTRTPRPLPSPVDLEPGDQAGESVSLRGRLAVIGAPRADVAGRIDRGRAWCVTLDDGPEETPGDGIAGESTGTLNELEPSTSITGLRFAASIAIGGAIAIGAPGADVAPDPFDPDSTVDRAGEVELFAIDAPHQPLGRRRRGSPGPLDRTGSSVGWIGTVLVSGSPRAECGHGRGGVITTFDRVPAESGLPCRPDGGLGGRISIAAGRLATGVPGRRDPDGRLDASVLLGTIDGAGVSPELEIENLGAGVLLDVAQDPDGVRLAIAVARDHEDESRPGLVWVIELTPAPEAAVAPPSPEG